MGVTVGEQYQQLWEAASKAERRPKKHAEEQEIDQLDLDHAEQGILLDFHTKKKKKNPKTTTLDIKAEMMLAAKRGKKSNNLQQIKGAQHLKALLCQHPSNLPLQIPLLGAQMIRKPVPGSKASNTWMI